MSRRTDIIFKSSEHAADLLQVLGREGGVIGEGLEEWEDDGPQLVLLSFSCVLLLANPGLLVPESLFEVCLVLLAVLVARQQFPALLLHGSAKSQRLLQLILQSLVLDPFVLDLKLHFSALHRALNHVSLLFFYIFLQLLDPPLLHIG